MQPFEPREQWPAGTVVERKYVIDSTLGRGSFGTAYRAHHRVLGRVFVIKRLHSQFAEDPVYVQKFIQEAQAIEKLRGCPNIVEIIDMTQTEDGQLILVMEAMEGGDLEALLRRTGPAPVDDALRYALQIAEALKAAHAAGLVHRDVKPENVLLGSDPKDAKLTDFGLVADRDSASPTSIVRGGSVGYAAPEQWQLSGKFLDGRADLYSLGVTLYRMLAGRLPYAESEIASWMDKVRSAPYPSLRGTRPDVPEALERLIGELLAVDRDLRPPDAAAVVERLKALRQQGGAAAGGIHPQRVETRAEVMPPVYPRPPSPVPAPSPLPPPPPLPAVVQQPYQQASPPPQSPYPQPYQPQPQPQPYLPQQVPQQQQQPQYGYQPPSPYPSPAPYQPQQAHVYQTHGYPQQGYQVPPPPQIVQPQQRSGGAFRAMVVIVPLLALAGYGAYWIYENRPPKVNPKDGLTYLWIRPGKFTMGCPAPAQETECDQDERPQHEVTISKGFYLSKTEVTVEAYRKFSSGTRTQMPPEPEFGNFKMNPGWEKGSYPINNVTWREASEYCGWMGGRLPSEAEWEYAARAGTTGIRYGPVEEVAWFADNSGLRPIKSSTLSREGTVYQDTVMGNQSMFHTVGVKPPNAFGLHDMLGNVWEWVGDWYDANYYSKSGAQDPRGPAEGKYHIGRGGSYYITSPRATATARSPHEAEYRNSGFGFRCAWDAGMF